MNLYNKLKKRTKKQATRKYVIQNVTPEFEDKFKDAQANYQKIYNVLLKYLYGHYGIKQLNVYMPTLGVKNGKRSMGFYYFIRRLNHIVVERLGKDIVFDRQSVDLFSESVVRIFNEYRKKQRKVRHWSDKNKEKYLNTHQCNLSGYGRIAFQHDPKHFKTISLKQNGTRAIYIINDHHIKIPYFKVIHTKQSLKELAGKKIVEAQVRQRKPGQYELHITTQEEIKRQTTKKLFEHAVGGDINSKNDEFFCFSDGYLIKWNPAVKKRYKEWDKKSRAWQDVINQYKYDDNSKLIYAKKQKQRCETKKANIMINWYRQIVVPTLVKRYPVLVMERLHTFGLRISKYKQGKLSDRARKNINNKLNNVIRPTTFLSILIDAYQKAGQTLILVDPTDTSKTCHYCHHINHDLRLEKKWICPNCGREVDRDYNATLNIRDWGIDPDKHIVVVSGELKSHPWVNKNDLVTVY